MSDTFESRLTYPIYLDACRLNLRDVFFSRRLLHGMALVVAIVTVAYAIADIVDHGGFGRVDLLSWLQFTGVVAPMMLVSCYGITWFMLPKRVRRLFAQQKQLHEPLRYTVGETELAYENSLIKGRMPLALAHRWVENSRVFLVHHSDMSFQLISKVEAPPAAIDCLRAGLMAAGIKGRSLK